MTRRITRARFAPAALRRIAVGEQGSFLVEAMISSLILVIVGLGVLESIDRGGRLGGEQKSQAVAGNVAQTEQELIRALPLAEQSNLHSTTTRAVGGVTYTIDSRAAWVNDISGDAGCTTAGSSADYMKVSTVVRWPQMGTRKPVTLESLITPGVRAFGANQGSLAVQVTGADGNGVGGLALNLSGGATLSDTTSSTGCVLWGYLSAGSGYAVGFSRPGYVQPDGSAGASQAVAVVGDQTSNLAFQYDLGGRLQTSFVTRRPPSSAPIQTNPQWAHVTNSGGGGVSLAFPVDGDRLTSGLLFPFTSAYTIHADSCAAAESPPETLPAPVSATVSRGTTTSPSTLTRLPALNIKVTSAGTPVTGPPAIVRVTSACGTVYRRTPNAAAMLDDPGFPYGRNLAVCVTDGMHRQQLVRDNTSFNAPSFTVDIDANVDPVGTCG